MIQDQLRALPVSRLYYGIEFGIPQDKRPQDVRFGPDDYDDALMEIWERLKRAIRKLAWDDYVRQFDR